MISSHIVIYLPIRLKDTKEEIKSYTRDVSLHSLVQVLELQLTVILYDEFNPAL